MRCKKLNSKKGQLILLLIAYPLMILAVTYGAISFLHSVGNTEHLRIFYDRMQAGYLATRGTEYIFKEIEYNLGSANPFITHTLDENGQLVKATAAPQLYINSAQIDSSTGAYTVRLGASTSNEVEAKIYKIDHDYFILTKGRFRGQERLFLQKINGTSVYDYAAFFTGDVSFGAQTLNADNAKIYSKGDVYFSGGAKITNLQELSTSGGFHWRLNPFVNPDDVTNNPDLVRTHRLPYVTANDGTTENYINHPDGSVPGMRGGILAFNTTTNSIVPWTPSHTYEQPIWPWGNAAMFPTSVKGNYNWTDSRQYAYLEENYNCTPGTCAKDNPVTYNNRYYHGMVSVNGKYIPPILPGNPPSYAQKIYYGPHDDTMNVSFTDSEKQSAAWQSYLSSIGLADTLKDNVPEVTLPLISIRKLISDAQTSSNSIVIQQALDPSTHAESILIDVNNPNPMAGHTITLTAPLWKSTQLCSGVEKTLFEVKQFMNSFSGLPEKAVVVNIGNLIACGEMLPTNGTILLSNAIYKIYHNPDAPIQLPSPNPTATKRPLTLIVENAKILPSASGGLRLIAEGSLGIKGEFNNPIDTANVQPAVAIASNNFYLLSDNFDYPSKLPVTQFRPNYPVKDTTGLFTAYPGGTGWDKAYVSNTANWFYDHEPVAVGGRAVDNALMANRATGGSDVDSDGVREIIYRLSLVGVDALSPKQLERWTYFESPGNLSTAPSNLVKRKPIVQGARVQLTTDQFEPAGPVITVQNNRACAQVPFEEDLQILTSDINGTLWSLSSPYCRNTTFALGNPPNLLASNEIAKFEYDTNLSDPNNLPPGDLVGLSIGLTVELPPTDLNWAQHPNAFCGNSTCDLGETCTSCEIDCQACVAQCPDGICDASETCNSCSADCGACIVCGDGTCSATENCSTCSGDCGACPPVCPDGTCNGTETCSTCAQDCGACCGNGACDNGETCSTCPADCGACPVCGDHVCNGTETCTTCPGDCGTCPSTCFLAGTLITMADGSTKPIEAIKKGDRILSYVEKSKKFKPAKVKKLLVHPNQKTVYLIINGYLKVTPNHPVFFKGKLVQIGTLKVGDYLLNEKGENEMIRTIENATGDLVTYNLSVKPYHTYIAGGIVVHNAGGGGKSES